MTDLEKTLVSELNAYIQRDKVHEIQVKSLMDNVNGLTYQTRQLSAMLADICEMIYGEEGKGIPKLFKPAFLHALHTGETRESSYLNINKGETWLEFFYKSEKKNLPEEELKEYKDFLELLRKIKEE